MKLFESLVERAWRLQYLLPEGSRLKWGFNRSELSAAMLIALLVRRVWKMSIREGREIPMILQASFTMRCKVFRQDAMLPPYHTAMQLVMMLSMVTQ